VAGGLRNLQQIHLEPYHNIGLSKRERLGMDASCGNELPDKRLLMEMAERISAQTGRETRSGRYHGLGDGYSMA